jgi:hypothetical protein
VDESSFPSFSTSRRGSIQHYVGGEALERLGMKRWSANADTIMRHLGDILDVNDLVVGGGNPFRLKTLPKHVRLGHNDWTMRL